MRKCRAEHQTIKNSVPKMNTSPSYRIKLLCKFSPTPAPLTGPSLMKRSLVLIAQPKQNKISGEGALSSRPFLTQMLPSPVSYPIWPFQLLETNSLGSWPLSAFPPRLLNVWCCTSSLSTQTTTTANQGFPPTPYRSSNNQNSGSSGALLHPGAHKDGARTFAALPPPPSDKIRTT